MPGPPPPAPDLVGREREQAALRAALDAALAGRGSLVLVGGEAGIGKTALAEWLCNEARDQGALTLVGRCYDLSETPPYGPWRELFTRAPRDGGLPVLPTAVLPPDREGEIMGSQGAIVARVSAYLAALAAAGPLIILLDDLHWADPASLDLLRVVARGLADLPLLILATYRPDEVAHGHRLATLTPLLVREARAAWMDLRPLDSPAIAALVAARYDLSAADRARLTAYLAARTEGNALYLGELLRTLEGGVLRQEGAAWQLADLDRVPVPALLRQVIAGRLGLLSAETQQLLALAAIVGQEVPLALWAAVGNLPEDALLGHIEEGIAARLLTEAPDGAGVRFAHALIREVVYEGTPALRRRGLHRRVAEALMVTPVPDPDAVAYHLQCAGDPRAADWLVAAAEAALRSAARRSAALRFEAALDLLPPRGAGATKRGWLLLRLTMLYHFADVRQGIAQADEAVRLAADNGDDVLAAYALCLRGLNHCNTGSVAAGLADLRAGVALFDALPASALELPFAFATPIGNRRVLVREYALAGRYAEALATGAALDAAPGHHGSPRPAHQRGSEGHAHLARAVSHAAMGRHAESGAAFGRARAAYREVRYNDLLGWLATHELRWLSLPYHPERLPERRALADEAEAAWARAQEQRADLRPLATEGLVARLPLLLVAGPWDAAAGLIGAVLSDEPIALWPRFLLGDLGWLACARGDRDAAWALLRRALPDGPATEPGASEYLPALALLRVAAALALDRADLDGARAWLDAHDRWLAWNGTVLGRAEGHLGWAAYFRAEGDSAQARRRAERGRECASDPRQPLALLAARRLLGELDTAAGRYADAAGHLAAALALAGACAAPYEQALALLALADLHAASGEPAAATATLEEARALLVPLEAIPALARAAALAARLVAGPGPSPAALPFGLTAREAEVLRLAAWGLPSAEIAARLFITPRTVGAHLTAIYAKLGVENRAAAIRVALDHDLR